MSSPRGLCDRDRCRAPLKRGKMTGAISLLFSAMALQDEGCVCICERESESEYEAHTHTEKPRRGRGSPVGFNKSGLHWTGESSRILPGKTGVYSVAGQRLWSGTSVISHNACTQRGTGWAEITQKQTPFPPPCTSLSCHSPLPPTWPGCNVKHRRDEVEKESGSSSRPS